ncbi:MAG TPA: class I SAM-dependent methyltransferase [Pseudonocardiaceae bacterium]
MPMTADGSGSTTTDPPRDTATFFNDFAELYDRFTRGLDAPEHPINRWLAQRLESGRRALDVGCGAGRYSVMLADRFDEVVGVDLAPAMIEIAERDRSRPNIRYEIRDILDMTPEQDGYFDLVLVLSCVMHVGPPGLLLKHLRRLVAEGGMLLLVDTVWQPEWGSPDWQADFAFRTARAAWDATGDLEDVMAALQFVLSPTLCEIAGNISVPSTRDDFLRECSAALPGVTIDDSDLLGVEVFAVCWHAGKAATSEV